MRPWSASTRCGVANRLLPLRRWVTTHPFTPFCISRLYLTLHGICRCPHPLGSFSPPSLALPCGCSGWAAASPPPDALPRLPLPYLCLPPSSRAPSPPLLMCVLFVQHTGGAPADGGEA